MTIAMHTYLLKEKIKINGAGDDAATRQADEKNKGVRLKNCVPFVSSKSGINNRKIDSAKDFDIVMLMYNLTENSYNYSKTSGSLWQYYKDEPIMILVDSESFKSKLKIMDNTPANGNTKSIEIIVPLKYLSNFWKTIEMSLINCEVYLILTWSSTCAITNSTGTARFAITDTKLYVPVVPLSIQDNTKLLQQLKSGFERAFNWNKYQSDPKI